VWRAAAGAGTEEVFGGHELPLPKKKREPKTEEQHELSFLCQKKNELSVPRKTEGKN
jgi:asparagine synthetase B (glutamine-hydrolysing)